MSSWPGLGGVLKVCFRFNWDHALLRSDSQELPRLVQFPTLSQALWLRGKDTASPQTTVMCRKEWRVLAGSPKMKLHRGARRFKGTKFTPCLSTDFYNRSLPLPENIRELDKGRGLS